MTARGGVARSRAASGDHRRVGWPNCSATTGRLSGLGEHLRRLRVGRSCRRRGGDEAHLEFSLAFDACQFGDEVVGVAAIIGLGEFYGCPSRQESAPLD